jgi:hypothetical protein
MQLKFLSGLFVLSPHVLIKKKKKKKKKKVGLFFFFIDFFFFFFFFFNTNFFLKKKKKKKKKNSSIYVFYIPSFLYTSFNRPSLIFIYIAFFYTHPCVDNIIYSVKMTNCIINEYFTLLPLFRRPFFYKQYLHNHFRSSPHPSNFLLQ